MGSESTYFFPPPAEPVHPQIDRRVVSWLDTFGRANAAAFDRQGWVYFKGESYDLFYPGYGDSYPSLRGAVGMTYEMAGGGRGGLALAPAGRHRAHPGRPRGAPLHRPRSPPCAPPPATPAAARRLRRRPARRRATGAARTYLWRADQPGGAGAGRPARASTASACASSAAGRPSSRPAARPAPRTEEERRFAGRHLGGLDRAAAGQPGRGAAGDRAPDARGLPRAPAPAPRAEPRHRVLRHHRLVAAARLQPRGLDGRGRAGGTLTAAGRRTGREPAPTPASGDGQLGFLVPPQGLASYRLAAALQQRGVRHRVALRRLHRGRRAYPGGHALRAPPRQPRRLRAGARRRCSRTRRCAGAGIASSCEIAGPLPGLARDGAGAAGARRPGRRRGGRPDLLRLPLVPARPPDRLPHDRLDLARLGEVDLAELDVLVLPERRLRGARIGEEPREALDAWVKAAACWWRSAAPSPGSRSTR